VSDAEINELINLAWLKFRRELPPSILADAMLEKLLMYTFRLGFCEGGKYSAARLGASIVGCDMATFTKRATNGL
jgi:hypothetical protein